MFFCLVRLIYNFFIMFFCSLLDRRKCPDAHGRMSSPDVSRAWWRCCCCCCCRTSAVKTPSAEDSNSLIPSAVDSTFYVPRRHSSFHTGTFSAVTKQPVGRCHSDSCSSSGDDDASTPGEHRGRCWSTIPATSATDAAVTVRCNVLRLSDGNIARSGSSSSQESDTSLSGTRTPLLLERKTRLAEIREVERSDEDSPPLSPTRDEVYGQLIFTTSYDECEQTLSVFVERASDLPRKSHHPDHESYNTFVRISLTSSRKNFLLTRTVKNTLNPVYKERHVLHTNRSKWKWSDALRLSVYDCDRQGRHDAVGHSLLPLAKISDVQEEHRLPLTPMYTTVKDIGQLLIGLFYSSNQSRLSIHVIRARHLRLDPDAHKRQLRPLLKGKDAFDSYVKVTLMCGGQKVKTNRSHVVPSKSDPFFNHRSDFVVPPAFLPESSVVVSATVRGPVIGRDVILGRVVAGPYVEMSGTQTHWGKMVQDSRSVVQWRNLYL